MNNNSTKADVESHLYSDFVIKATNEYNQNLIKRIGMLRKNYFYKQNISILDVGTGTGLTLIDMTKNNNFINDELIGVDFCMDMIDEANKNSVLYNLENKIQFKKMDVHNMDFINEKFDFIIGRSVIHHWANPVIAFKEIFRILKHDGICVIHEPSKCPSEQALKYFNNLRKSAGHMAMNLDDKHTPDEVISFLQDANINEFSVKNGQDIYSIGFEVCIMKTS
jgi:ubiquinone/menaquinone biosynthesis C-methylase UbiE